MQGVNAALAALDATQVDVDSDAVGALELLNRAEQSLRSIRVDGIFAEASERLQSISTDLSDVIFTLSQEIEQQEHVEDLDSLNARIHALGELTRRWGPGLADVIAWRDKAELDVQDLDASPEKVQELEEERDRLLGVAVAAAQRLSSARKAAAKSLSVTVSDELSSLAMSGARLDIEVRERHGSSNELAGLDSHGHDDIEFLFTPFPGSPKLSMGKSASGGELSRLMLSLELAAAGAHTERDSAAGSGMTFIFDEVDAGVGGKAAVQLGRRLASLARHAQVLVVTHLPQVASWADAQFVVSKGDADAAGSGDSADSADSTESGPSVVTCVNEVTGEPRVHEIARMLSGSESQASLEHARELLASSRL
jgi:DNA repair protein RecN (Recombination protein N)